MTQEDKELLLKDLCSRLPYGVIVQVKDWTTFETELKVGHIQRLQNEDTELKPFLRSMLSMTEEEKKIFLGIRGRSSRNTIGAFVPNGTIDTEYKVDCIVCSLHNYSRNIDWLLAHHFDYHGLIEKGLAIEVTEENNPYETELS